MDTLPATADRAALIAELEAQAAILTTTIDAYQAQIGTLRRDVRIVLSAVKALRRGDGLQPGLPAGDAAPMRAVTHAEPAMAAD